MDWKKHFTSTMLSRGKAYFKQNRVVNYTERRRMCTARVMGRSLYTVVIHNPGTPNMIMECDCPHSEKGFTCKHMAAVMYAWEEAREEDAAGRDVPPAFPRVKAGEEPFFYIADIASPLKIRAKTNLEARRYIEEGLLTLDDFHVVFDPYAYGSERDMPTALVSGIFRNGETEKNLAIIMSNQAIHRYDCDVCDDYYYEGYGYYGYYGRPDKAPCAHITALLMLADEYTKAFDPGDYTDYSAIRFLSAFDREVHGEDRAGSFRRSGTVTLEPRIVETATGLELNFRISNGGKYYVVKNLTRLFDAVSEHRSFSLGKKDGVDFASESFDADSEKLFALIEHEVKRARAIDQKMERKITYRYQGTLETGKGIPFVGEVIDTIYEMKAGGTIECKRLDSRGKTNVTVEDHDPVVHVRIDAGVGEPDAPENSRNGSGFLLVYGETPLLIDGIESRYFISDRFFSRLSDEAWSHIRPFTEASDTGENEFSFTIGEKRAAEFYYHILPELKNDPIFRIEENGNVSGMVHEEACFSFFLDADETDITCEAFVSYGDEQLSMRPLTKDDFPLPPERDIHQESPVFMLLDKIFGNYDSERGVYLASEDDDRRYDLMRNGIDRLMEYGDVNATNAFSRRRIRRTPVIQVGVSLENDLMDLQILTKEMDRDELTALLESYRLKKRYHKLNSGEYIDLEQNESIEALMDLMDSLDVTVSDFVNGKIHIPAYRALYLEKMLEGHEDLVADRDRTYKNLLRNFKTINDADFDPPESLRDTLRPYQDFGFRWLKTLEEAGFGGILADDMGLGKTLQMIALLLSDREQTLSAQPHPDAAKATALVVCPASLVYNWVEEVGRFAPDLSIAPVAGTKRERRKLLETAGEYDILVTSYDLLKRDIDMYEPLEFSHQILDEAQYIKNAGSAAAKSVRLIHASHKFALTGTPIENRLSELWSIFDYLMPGFLFSYDHFRKTFEIPISKGKDEKQTSRLRAMVAPFLLRRKKTDVLKDLPDKLEEIHYARLEDEQRKIYDGQVAKIRRILESQDDVASHRIQILAELTRVRQICCDPGLLFEDYPGESAKREACLDLIRSAIDGGHKLLLFSQFTSMLELLRRDLDRDEIGYYILTGSTPKQERLRLVNAFNTNDVPVFLISLKAGGTGLNLIGADIVIHYDPWWNLAAQNQATDRAHRIGQTKNVTEYRIIAKDTIEEKILNLQESKRELADSILTGEGRSLATMSKEELLELLDVDPR